MSTPRRRRVDRGATTPVSTFALALLVLTVVDWRPACAPGQQVEDAPARQVTLLGVIASPDDPGIDPKLVRFEPQLRKLLPGHGFRLLDVQSMRLTTGQAVTCDLQGGFQSSITLVQPTDDNGKVQLRCTVLRNQSVLLETVVTTPPNQLFFCDKVLDGGKRLLIGVGAR